MTRFHRFVDDIDTTSDGVPTVRINYENEIVEAMLRHIYTSALPQVTALNGYALFSIANRYQLAELRDFVRYQLPSAVNDDNAIDYLILAHNHNIKSLRKVCMRIISENVAKFIKKKEWAEMGDRHPLLVDQLLVYLARKKAHQGK